MTETNFHGVIVAAGLGQRLGGVSKQYRVLNGEEVWLHALRAMNTHPLCRGGVVVCPDGRENHHQSLLTAKNLQHWCVARGGQTRQDSVKAGLSFLQNLTPRPELVMIHDAARPFIPQELLTRLIATCSGGAQAAIPVIPSSDSLKKCEDGIIGPSLNRENIMRVQTPQIFCYDMISALHERYAGKNYPDDSSLVEAAGLKVLAAEGNALSFKITDETDWEMALMLFNKRSFETRVGTGYDLHRFSDTPGQIMICGVAIDHDRGIIAHSDGDVGLHAATDALLGALGEGDIGLLFPPSDPALRHASSEQFLMEACSRLDKRGGYIINLDLTLITETPKITPHREAMIAKLSEIAQIEANRVSVKATTHEGLDAIGEGKGLACQALVTIALPERSGA